MTGPQELAVLDAEVVAVGFSALSDTEREIVDLRYGLHGNGAHTCREAGEVLGRHGSRIASIQHRAIYRIRKRLVLMGLARGAQWWWPVERAP